MGKNINESVNVEENISNNNYKKIIILLVVVLLFLSFIKYVANNTSDKSNEFKNIKNVKKVLLNKYDDIKCVDKKCDYVVGEMGNGLGKTTYNIFNLGGKKIASYKVDYSKDDSKLTDIYAATENYIITRTIKNNTYFYVLRNNNGKEKYSSNNKMEFVNNYLVAIRENSEYKLLDKNGRIIVDKIKNYKEYIDGKFISVEGFNGNFIVNKKGNKILDKSIVSNLINEEKMGKDFLIVQDTETNLYNYFDIKKCKKIGESFTSYSVNSKGNIVVCRKSNGKEYILKNNGKQVKYNGNLDKDITKNIDFEEYYVYKSGIKNENQKFVVANKKSDKTLGILNLKTKEFSRLYNYSNDAAILNSTVSTIENSENSVVRITCSKEYCGEMKNIIYDLTANKKIYNEKKNDVLISSFTLYEDGYKVIKYSSLSDNLDYADNSYLYDKDNKKIDNNSYNIVVIDKEVKIGKIYSSELVLYSTTENKRINDITSLASKIVINDNVIFRYKDSKNINFYNDNGDKLFEVPSKSYVLYTNNYIIYVIDDKINMYNVDKNRTKKYKLKNNESMNNEYGELVSPYRGTIILNNNSSKKIKLLSCSGNVIRKIENAQLSEVKKAENGKLLLIVKSKEKYGLYIAD